MEWYYLLGAVSYGIFIIQFILSWFGGDTDLDIDMDGNVDMDVSDIVSFKGILHFIMGFSGWLCTKSTIGAILWYDYLVAIICGILLMIILYYLYKLCLKLQHQSVTEESESLVGRTGTIYLDLKTHYLLTIEVNGHSEDIKVYPLDDRIIRSKGELARIVKFEEGKYYI